MTSVTQKEDEGHDSEEDECVVDEEPDGEGRDYLGGGRSGGDGVTDHCGKRQEECHQ